DDFFFQAEDGIRDRNVTGVQTCALPILKDFATQIKISIACYICVTSARRRDEVANRRKDLNHLQTKTVKHFNNYSSTQFNKPNMATNQLCHMRSHKK